MMVSCISLDRDCANICALTARLVARGSAHGQRLLRECAEVCKACGDECAKHAHRQRGQACADACRRWEEACRAAFEWPTQQPCATREKECLNLFRAFLFIFT